MAIQPLPLPDPQHVSNASLGNARNPLEFYTEAIKAQFAMDDWDEALKSITELNKRTNAGFDNQLVQYTANYKGAVRDRTSFMIDNQQFQMTLARTRAGLLQVLDDLPKRLQLRAQTQSGDSGAFSYRLMEKDPLEKVLPGSDNLYKIAWVEKALKYAKAVCRVVTPDDKGSGFITSNGYLFTNNHVIKNADAARGTTIEFNFRTDLNGRALDVKRYQLDASTFYTNPDLDFSYVKVIDQPANLLNQWGFVEFDAGAALTAGDAVTIIQHAGGDELQIALDANKVISKWDQYLFYDTPTLGGSSGSPVFNQAWKVVALHHAGFSDTVVNAQGERRGANRGILFKDIFEDLKAKNLPIPA